MSTLHESLQYTPQELAFGTSGLRGLVTDMTDLECYINTRGFLIFLAGLRHVKPHSIVYIGGDLRQSTPRILSAVTRAIEDAGYTPAYVGFVPTPSIAFYALQKHAPCIMVTGSHIPDDRNGIKFYKADGEVLKTDEVLIQEAVAVIRRVQYEMPAEDSPFNEQGMLRQAVVLPPEDSGARELYHQRYISVFSQALTGKKIVFYQHSAVGRDQLVAILQALGAEVIPVGRSDKFISIDSENITPEHKAHLKQLSKDYPDAFAVVSTDGDSDRPLVIDEQGTFHRGDVLGALVAEWLQADFAAFPVSVSDGADTYLNEKNIPWKHTQIGSPYVIEAMQTAMAAGKRHPVGWEANGGVLIGADLSIKGRQFAALPTRDALLPIIAILCMAIDKDCRVSELFLALPRRFSDCGLIDNFPTTTSQAMITKFTQGLDSAKQELATYFSTEKGFGDIEHFDLLDGIRIFFTNGDVAHLRPSGNAPQLRIYSVADTRERASEIVAMAIAEPDGIFRQIEKSLG